MTAAFTPLPAKPSMATPVSKATTATTKKENVVQSSSEQNLAMRQLGAEAAKIAAAKKPTPTNIKTTNPLLSEKTNTPTSATPKKSPATNGVMSPRSIPLPQTPTSATTKAGAKATPAAAAKSAVSSLASVQKPVDAPASMHADVANPALSAGPTSETQSKNKVTGKDTKSGDTSEEESSEEESSEEDEDSEEEGDDAEVNDAPASVPKSARDPDTTPSTAARSRIVALLEKTPATTMSKPKYDKADERAFLDDRGYSGALIRGQNPAEIFEKGVRDRITNHSNYWKEQCFGLNAATLCDRAAELKFIGGTSGIQGKPTHFLCLAFKLLLLVPEKAIILEMLNFPSDENEQNGDEKADEDEKMDDDEEDSANEKKVDLNAAGKLGDFKYLRCLAAFYIRLAWEPVEIYKTLEPLLTDYRKIKRRLKDGYTLTHIDQFVDDLLTKDRICATSLWKLPPRAHLEDLDLLDARESPLDGEVDVEGESSEEDRKEEASEEEDDEASIDAPKATPASSAPKTQDQDPKDASKAGESVKEGEESSADDNDDSENNSEASQEEAEEPTEEEAKPFTPTAPATKPTKKSTDKKPLPSKKKPTEKKEKSDKKPADKKKAAPKTSLFAALAQAEKKKKAMDKKRAEEKKAKGKSQDAKDGGKAGESVED
jgi:pre-mRNA-splicing factor 38A